MYLILDCETTGLPLTIGYNHYYDYKDNTKYDSSRIVQLAWQLIDNSGQILSEKDYIVKRDGFDIKNAKIHGITNEISDNGVSFAYMCSQFMIDVKRCEYIIAHNLLFDYTVIMNHLYRYDLANALDIFQKKKQYCTMLNSIDVLKIPLPWTGRQYKNPSLAELYDYCVGGGFAGAHNAKHDVEACKRCFLKLIETTALV